jgi:primosomal protein N' (replication factor Y)
LLYGVTGSGKTEVYLRAAQEAVAGGGKVLILIPEIALSPQMVHRVETRFGNRAALWHSALTPTRRREVWARTRRGEIDVLVGARSAVFSPIPDLRLIVVDEEHEGAYKQAESPRYHARDVALVRARIAGAVTVLGSATPSLESFANAKKGKYRLLTLPHRVERRPRSRVELVPLPRAEEGARPVSMILSDRLRRAMAEVLSRKEQCILFLNRRGHSTVVQCESCRHVLHCNQCDIALTWHSVGDRVICHYCGRRRTTPGICPACEGTLSVFKGVGTQRVAGEIARLFSGARVLRVDTDSMRKRGALDQALEAFQKCEADILLGTQMVAKGLDFPDVTLVGVINADLQLALPDFRSAERTFQLLTQVAGRSGRGTRPGNVVFQTNHPDHYALISAAAQDYEAFFAEEMSARRDPPYPPYVRLVNLLMDGKDEDQLIEEAERTAEFLSERMREEGSPVELLGPAPQPFSRLKGKHRWHITLRGSDHHRLRDLAGSVLARPESASRAVRVTVDVDPVSLL